MPGTEFQADWLQKTASQLLPCEHGHIIFTVPEQLNVLWQFNRRRFADELMTAARLTIEELYADSKYVGAQPGVISALHTWGRNLSIHPHVHCLVTAGGTDVDGHFVAPKRAIVIPGGVLRAVFRGKLLDALRTALGSGDLRLPPSLTEAKCRSLLNRLGRVKWNVRIAERYRHGVSVAGYLARYLVGGPIGDKRICSVTADEIVFRYRDHRDGEDKLMHLTPDDFLGRWFEHVPPRHLRTIRRSGLYANCRARVRECIAAQLSPESAAEAKNEAMQVQPLDAEVCPRCNTQLRVTHIFRPPVLHFPATRLSALPARPP